MNNNNEINLSEDIDWEKVFGIIDSVSTLTRNQTRPLRTEIVEKAIAEFSNGKLRYVGDEKNGMDFEGVDGLRYECKMQATIFQPRTLHSNKVVLKNHRGENLGLPEKTFDKMIFIDTKKRKVGVVRFEELTMINKPAVVYCHVEDQSIIQVVAENVVSDEEYSDVNMESVIFAAIDKVINKAA